MVSAPLCGLWRRLKFTLLCCVCVLCIGYSQLILTPWIATTRHQSAAASRHLPDCLIIGARKGGTRALLQFLTIHPKVCIVPQEIHFFDNSSIYNLTTEWYHSQMPLCPVDSVVIEKTPAYLVSPLAPARVHQLNARMKLILVVRDPVVRTISDYTQVVHSKLSKGKVVTSFEKAVLNSTNRVRTKYKPIRNSLYADHLRRWLAHFPLDQMHIVDGDGLIVRPLDELKSVEQFLGLQPYIRATHIYFNKTKGFHCYRHPIDGDICLGDSKGRSQVKISSKTKARLRTFFRNYNQQFYAMVNRTFPW